MPHLTWFFSLTLCAGSLAAQTSSARHTLEVDAAGVFPANGYLASGYSAGPALRAGYTLRLHRFVAADVGWTSAWLPGTSCSRFGCEHPRYQNRLLDYGLRGVLPLAQGRVEVSVGVGGGYFWYDRASYDTYYNSALLQYSGKASVAINRGGRLRCGFTLRAWRDLGRPIQQWLSTEAGISFGFGSVR